MWFHPAEIATKPLPGETSHCPEKLWPHAANEPSASGFPQSERKGYGIWAGSGSGLSVELLSEGVWRAETPKLKPRVSEVGPGRDRRFYERKVAVIASEPKVMYIVLVWGRLHTF